jgi:hypothetical protein
MTGPALRATTESGDVWDDPSEDKLFEILGEIERGDELFLVVERLSDPGGQTYIQTIIEGESFVVEHREGSAERHFRTVVPGRDEAYAVFTAWVHQLPGWREALAWELAPLDQVAPGS